MGKRGVVVAGIALVVGVLAGCSAPDPAPTVTVTVNAEPTPTATSSALQTAPSPSAAPLTCEGYVPTPFPQADGGNIADAVSQTPLPAGVSLNPGVQTVTSTDEPGMFEAVVRVCSKPLSEEALIDVANVVAMSLAQSPAGETVSVLVVSGWSPDGKFLKQDESVRSDFQMFTWDPNAAVPMSSNWK